MDLTKIISISEMPAFYNLVSQAKRGSIVVDLEKLRKTTISAKKNVSLLKNVSIDGIAEEYPLKDVFTRIYNKENGGPAISHKESSEKLREYMEEILPEYDESRVYNSDLKKLFQWYNLLQSKDLITPAPENSEENLEEVQAKEDTVEENSNDQNQE